MKTCPKCGVENGPQARECHACGIVFERYGRHALRRPGRSKGGIGLLLVGLAGVVIVLIVMNTPVRERLAGGVEDTSDTADTAVVEAVEARPKVAGAELIIVPVEDGGRWFADVYMTALDSKALPTQFEGEAEVRWGLVTANRHRETVELGEWVEGELPHAPGQEVLYTLVHSIEFDPSTAQGMPLKVTVIVEGLEVRGVVSL